ncbi:hypothetical protein EJ04DRAFT_505324 [Polyplosphaeria fusca]|uniref:Transcription factor TFIIIC complex subunit Tfc6 n=1 Tax=Polyplosphaeria fusca TaxID=682080 RepID=A0A9P4QLI2_9PLEO|nr:hypothetical protein EJ04DRAFT_505324 [Polyplosphaeria fusca]
MPRARLQRRAAQAKNYEYRQYEEDVSRIVAEDGGSEEEPYYMVKLRPEDDGAADEYMGAAEQHEDMMALDEAEGVEETGSQVPIGAESTPPITPTRTSGSRNSRPSQTPNRASTTKAKTRGVNELRDRGPDVIAKTGGQHNRLKILFGPTEEEKRRTLLTRDHWSTQETLPERDAGGLRHSYNTSEEARKREIQNVQKWYDRVGKKSFSQRQKSTSLARETGEGYLANSGSTDINMLMGAFATPRMYTLKQGQHLSTALPFLNRENRHGWMLYLGTGIQDAQWAPHEHERTQYLAVAVEQKRMTGHQNKLLEYSKAPAFNPTKQFPASIQIWALEPTPTCLPSDRIPPRLAYVICAEWGAPEQFRWCPFVPDESVQDMDTIYLGLLAGIWSDGRVRILDIYFENSKTANPETKFVQYTHAAFEISFRDTVPTCLQWLSATTLAVTTASGTIAYWTLSHSSAFAPSSHPAGNPYNPPPRFHRVVADTYIITLQSGFPSQPHVVSIGTASGLSILIDLRDPSADTCLSPRGRVFNTTQAWHEHTQSFVHPDEYHLLRHNPLRRFYMNFNTMRLESQIVRCATSPVHPGILVGGADGTVIASNPFMRFLNYKLSPWQQTWFRHEWRRSVSEIPLPIGPQFSAPLSQLSSRPTTPLSDLDAVPDGVLNKPLVRITEGYKVQQINLINSQKPGKEKAVERSLLTIHEEKSAISVLAWNPNLRYGTWAVAGMADGLLRIEDVGV